MFKKSKLYKKITIYINPKELLGVTLYISCVHYTSMGKALYGCTSAKEHSPRRDNAERHNLIHDEMAIVLIKTPDGYQIRQRKSNQNLLPFRHPLFHLPRSTDSTNI